MFTVAKNCEASPLISFVLILLACFCLVGFAVAWCFVSLIMDSCVSLNGRACASAGLEITP